MSVVPEPATGSEPGEPPRRRVRITSVVVLTVTWLLLWGHVTLLLVLTGVLVALLVNVVFPLPAIDLHGRFRPVGALRLVGTQLVDITVASLSVVALVFRFGTIPQSSIIRVQLRSRSEVYLAQTAELVSLVPGTIVLESRRSRSILYLHVLNQTEPAELATTAQLVLDAEERVLRAFGSDAEIAALDAGRPLPHGGPG
ncbi:MAG: Na+/H+ antiporter subunit E [Propionibacteriaceae bacterium]